MKMVKFQKNIQTIFSDIFKLFAVGDNEELDLWNPERNREKKIACFFP